MVLNTYAEKWYYFLLLVLVDIEAFFLSVFSGNYKWAIFIIYACNLLRHIIGLYIRMQLHCATFSWSELFLVFINYIKTLFQFNKWFLFAVSFLLISNLTPSTCQKKKKHHPWPIFFLSSRQLLLNCIEE